jgi:hypothetical protein
VVYHLDCQDCGFESTVEGNHESLLDAIDAHHEECDVSHFVEFELVE